MKAYKAFLAAGLGLGVFSLLIGCDDEVMAPRARAARQVTVIVSPASAEIAVDETARFTAATLEGERLEASQVRWMTSDPEKARIVGDGLVLGVAPGAVAITAQHPAGTGRAQVRVRYAPGSGHGGGDRDGGGERELPEK